MRRLLIFIVALFAVSASHAVVITFTVSTTTASNVQEAICWRFRYLDKFPDGTPNPETKAAFAKRMIWERFVREMIRAYQAGPAIQAAEESIIGQVDQQNGYQ